MTETTRELLQAIYGLRKAAEAQFTGNAYYQVANEIAGLLDLVGWGDGSIPAGTGAAYGFATMLAEVRKCAEASTSGNQYYMIAHKLDVLASYITPAASVPAPAAPVSEKPAAAPAPATAPAPGAVAESAPAPSPKTETPVELLQAVLGLRRAAQEQFPDSAYDKVGKEIAALIETVGGNEASVPPGKDAAYGFATMLDEVRRLAKAHTSGNQYFSIAVKLDGLASHLTPAAPVSERPAAPAASAHTPSASEPTFADLAAASKARVEQVAASLGIASSHYITAPEPELERRSSEPCSMAELAPIAAEAAPMPADHAQHMAGGDGAAKCPFQAMFADTAAEPAPAGSENVASFGELAAASKAQVEHVSASLAVASAPSQAEAVEAPSERRLESRSSAGIPLEPVEPAALRAETAAEPEPAEMASHLGSPAAQGDAELEETVLADIAAVEEAPQPALQPQEAAPEAPAQSASEAVLEEVVIVDMVAVEEVPQPEVQTQAAAPEAAAPSASGAVFEEVVIVDVVAVEEAPQPEVQPQAAVTEEAARTVEPAAEEKQPEPVKPKQQKTLFKLWLDLAFGRKD